MKKIMLLLLLAFSVALAAGCGTKETAKEPAKEESQGTKLAYVGSETCKGCHIKAYEAWSKTLHTKMVQDAKADAAVIIGDFSKPGNPFEKATNLKKEDIVYTVGSKWKQRYVWKDGDALRFLPAEWIVKDQKWQPYKDKTWQTLDYGQTCTGCHNTGYDPQKKTWTENGVGCEACHGPGSKHVAKAAKDNIINPKNLDAKKQVEVCGQCHVRGQEGDNIREDAVGYIPGGDDFAQFMKPLTPSPEELAKEKPAFYPDGASKKHHQQYNDFVQSKHYAGGMSCTTCHDAHGGVEAGQLKDKVENICFSCHNKGGKAQTKLDEPLDIKKYMPKRAKSATAGDITTHTFKLNQPVK
ncbi:MAG: cytochrome c3 family protein [Bacillota bacterium]